MKPAILLLVASRAVHASRRCSRACWICHAAEIATRLCCFSPAAVRANRKASSLTHRNIIGNVSQFSGHARRATGRSDSRVAAVLSQFRLHGHALVSADRRRAHSSLTRVHWKPAKIAALVERYAATMMCATPTFLRGYLRKAEPAATAQFAARDHGRRETAGSISPSV